MQRSVHTMAPSGFNSTKVYAQISPSLLFLCCLSPHSFASRHVQVHKATSLKTLSPFYPGQKWTKTGDSPAHQRRYTNATKKKRRAGCGGIGGFSVEDPSESPSWLQRRWLQRGLSGRRLETRALLVMPSADHRLPDVSVPSFVDSPPLSWDWTGCVQTWGLKLYRSSGRGCGLRSQADGTTTPIRIRSWTRCICTSGCSCCVSPSRCTWWVSVHWPSAPEGN
jgi:hypothetical protein